MYVSVVRRVGGALINQRRRPRVLLGRCLLKHSAQHKDEALHASGYFSPLFAAFSLSGQPTLPPPTMLRITWPTHFSNPYLHSDLPFSRPAHFPKTLPSQTTPSAKMRTFNWLHLLRKMQQYGKKKRNGATYKCKEKTINTFKRVYFLLHGARYGALSFTMAVSMCF